MESSYLLDTSALRSMSARTLAALGRDSRLVVSPFCFWEVMTHLDEERNFDRFKIELMKFKSVCVLDDLCAAVEAPLLKQNYALQNRVPDNDLIAAALAALRESTSLDDFYSKYIEDARGRVHSIVDCAALGRKALLEEEQRYLGFVGKILNLLSNQPTAYDSNAERHRAILSLVEGWVIQLQNRGAAEAGLRQALITHSYFYYSYIFHRSLRYFTRSTKQLDENDYEDANLCLHLNLRTEYCVVAADKGLRDAISQTISLLKSLQDSFYKTTAKVRDIFHIVDV